MVFNDFRKATLAQLQQILRNEDSEIIYKCAAETELERRAAELGCPINYGVWYERAFR